MSDDPSDAVQLAIRPLLLADSRVIAAFGTKPAAVWDTVPVDSSGRVITAAFPYITLGEGDQVIGTPTSCGDVDEVIAMINVWSRTTDYGECRAIAGAVRRALNAPLTLTGHNYITGHFQSGLYRKEPDGLTRRGILTFRFETAPWA